MLTLTLLLLAADAPAATLEVCNDCTYKTLEAAWIAAAAGDVIKLGEGRWTPGHLTNRSGTLTLEGAGPDKTVIACNGAGALTIGTGNGTFTRTFRNFTFEQCATGGRFYSVTGVTLVLEDLRLIGGDSLSPIASAGSSATVRRSSFTPPPGKHTTPGRYLDGIGSWTIEDSVFIGADATPIGADAPGGAIKADYGGLTIRRSRFVGNLAGKGGAIYLYDGSSISRSYSIEDTVFCGNVAGHGGAVYADGYDDAPVILRSVFLANEALSGSGGAIVVLGGPDRQVLPQFVNLSVVANVSADAGSGIFLDGPYLDPVLQNSLFAYNGPDPLAAFAADRLRSPPLRTRRNNAWYGQDVDIEAPGVDYHAADVLEDPRLVDLPPYDVDSPGWPGCDADLRLVPDSPLLGAAATTTGGLPDIGARGAIPLRELDRDGDGAFADVDCDDDDADVHPGADELCNGIDDDCDGQVDEDPADGDTYFADLDGDGHGDPRADVRACHLPSGHVVDGDDCDDADELVHPGAPERCNDGVDDDCDPSTGDDDGPEAVTWYADADGDDFGDPGSTVAACERPSGYVADGTDCDDTDDAVHPGAPELCNDGGDDDCDPTTGDDDGPEAVTWYADVDDDGFGDPGSTALTCEAPPGHVADATDCDDLAADVHPGAPERCNDGVDDDCDPTTLDDDGPDALTWHADADGDGFGDPSASLRRCVAPTGYVSDANDCDDLAADVHPGAPERCNGGIDDDCDPLTLDDDGPDALTWYADADGDGHGAAGTEVRACEAPDGHVALGDDCDDADAGRAPSAPERCNLLDDDCDGLVDEDLDCDAPNDTGAVDDTGDASSEVIRTALVGGAGCSTRPGAGWSGWLLLLGLIRRRASRHP